MHPLPVRPRLRLLLVALAAGLTAPAARADETDARRVAGRAREVLKTYCQRCHHGQGSEGGDFDVLTLATLTAPHDDDKPYLVAGKPDESLLLRRVLKNGMPPKAVRERPTDADKAALRAWVEAGLPAFPAAAARPFVSTRDVLAAVRDHLRAARAEDRPFLRFFTLTHVHNNPRVPDADLRVSRAALAKALNSLSWKRRLVVPQAIDPQATVFAVDERDLDWDRQDLWRAVIKVYPYGLCYGTHADPDLQKLDDDISDLTDGDMVVVRADWFVATATRPPLYHTLLGLPRHAGDLEQRLGVDVLANIRRDRAVRAGFAVSGVSGQNRLVERHDAEYGSYWKSYDFKANNDRSNLTQFPLGPAFPDNPFPRQAFRHDGGEIIFNLPNGLQGYLLVNGKDERIDEGPIEVVSDALKTSGTPAIVTGLSCMACHKHGMIECKDLVRDGTAVAGLARVKVQRLYPGQKALDEWVKEDCDRFLRADVRVTAPFLKVGPDRDKDIRDFAEPVGEVARLYRLVDLGPAEVAAELGLQKPADLEVLLRGNRKLRELGLAPLLQGGAVKRHDWEALPGTSLFHLTARELEVGTPFRVVK
jgi:serine/threonine-protein kinase